MKKVRILFALLIVSCAHRPPFQIVSPEKQLTSLSWSSEELARDPSVKTLRVTGEASYHLIRLNGKEKPHTHDDHDLAVFVLKGKALLHLGERTVTVRAGDVIEITRGTVHWAENLSGEPALVYAVFTPSFDGKDHHPVEN